MTKENELAFIQVIISKIASARKLLLTPSDPESVQLMNFLSDKYFHVVQIKALLQLLNKYSRWIEILKKRNDPEEAMFYRRKREHIKLVLFETLIRLELFEIKASIKEQIQKVGRVPKGTAERMPTIGDVIAKRVTRILGCLRKIDFVHILLDRVLIFENHIVEMEKQWPELNRKYGEDERVKACKALIKQNKKEREAAERNQQYEEVRLLDNHKEHLKMDARKLFAYFELGSVEQTLREHYQDVSESPEAMVVEVEEKRAQPVVRTSQEGFFSEEVPRVTEKEITLLNPVQGKEVSLLSSPAQRVFSQ